MLESFTENEQITRSIYFKQAMLNLQAGGREWLRLDDIAHQASRYDSQYQAKHRIARFVCRLTGVQQGEQPVGYRYSFGTRLAILATIPEVVSREATDWQTNNDHNTEGFLDPPKVYRLVVDGEQAAQAV